MPGFDYQSYKKEFNNGTPELISDIKLLKAYNKNYKQLLVDALEGKIELYGIKHCIDPATIENSMESRQGQATLYNAYIIGLMSAPQLIDWAEKYSMVQSIPLQQFLSIKTKDDMIISFDNDQYESLSQPEKDGLYNEVKALQEERVKIIRTTKDIINAIEKGIPIDPDERRKDSPEDSILNYERLLDEQRTLNSTKDTEDFNPSKIAYLQRVKDDYETFLEMGDGQSMRARFTEAYNRLAKGEILFKSQPTFDQGIDGKRQILNYLNDIECVGTDAFVELYGSKKDIEHYNINHLENETAGRTPAENAKRSFYRDGSLRDDQVEKMIYDSLSMTERYMAAFDMKTPNDAGNALDDENKAKAFEVLKQAKEAYYKCSPLSQFFGLIFPTEANKCQKQIDFIRADLVKKGMTKEEIKMTENAKLVAEPLFKDNNKPAKSNEVNVDAPKQENNKGKEHVNMSNEFGKGGLGEFDNSKKTEQIDKNKDLSANKDLNNSKNDIKMDK